MLASESVWQGIVYNVSGEEVGRALLAAPLLVCLWRPAPPHGMPASPHCGAQPLAPPHYLGEPRASSACMGHELFFSFFHLFPTRTKSFKCLERAAVRVEPPGGKDRWLVTATEVEELK